MRRRLTSMGHAATPQAGCTSHVSVVDRDGTMVSLTNTLLSRFGSRVALPHAGIIMNNGMMWFDPRPRPAEQYRGRREAARQHVPAGAEPGRPTACSPSARPAAARSSRRCCRSISCMADFGLSLEEAFHRPRIDASDAAHQGRCPRRAGRRRDASPAHSRSRSSRTRCTR